MHEHMGNNLPGFKNRRLEIEQSQVEVKIGLKKPNVMPESPDSDTQWTQVIEPHGHAFDLKLGELWRYRDL